MPEEVFQVAGLQCEALPGAEWPYRLVRVEGVAVRIRESGQALRVLVEGTLPRDALDRLIAGLVANVEGATNQPIRALPLWRR